VAPQVVLKNSQWFGALGKLKLEYFDYVFGCVYPSVLTLIPAASDQIGHAPGSAFTTMKQDNTYEWSCLYGPLTFIIVVGGTMLSLIFWKLISVSGPRGLLRYTRLLSTTMVVLLILALPLSFKVYSQIYMDDVTEAFQKWAECTSLQGAQGVPPEESGCTLSKTLSFDYYLAAILCAPVGSLCVCVLLGVNRENLKGLRALASRLRLMGSSSASLSPSSTTASGDRTSAAPPHSANSNYSGNEVVSSRSPATTRPPALSRADVPCRKSWS
jgi:hypothetical protein